MPVAARVGVHAAEAAQPLGGQREHRESGTGADPLVLGAQPDHGVAVAIRRGAGGRGRVELQPAELMELEERTPAADEQRIAQRAAAERRLVVAAEDAERELVVGGKGQDPERLDAALAVQLLLAEEAREYVGPVDLR